MQTKFLKTLALTAVLTLLAVATTTHVRATDANTGRAGAQRLHTQVSANHLLALAQPVMSTSTTQGLSPAQIEAAVEEYFASVAAFDVPRFVNNFAPNGVLEDPVGTPPIQGTQAITAFITNIIAPFSEIKPKIEEIVVCGNEAAVDWKLKLKTTTGKHITIDGMGVFTFNNAGKLQSVREFWDLAAFLAQLQS